MKKFIPVFISMILGFTAAFIFYKRIDANSILNDHSNAVAIQIGVFTKKENAEKLKNNYGGIVVEDDGLYRVYYSVLTNSSNLDFVTDYLKNSGVNYYLKRVTLNDSTLEILDKYESLMESTKVKTKIKVNDELLKSIEDVI